jgi:hypothetical protein
MRVSPLFAVPVVLTVGLFLTGCSSPAPVPSSSPAATSVPSDVPEPSNEPSVDPSAEPEETLPPVSTPAPVEVLKEAGLVVGEDAKVLAEKFWPEGVPVIDFDSVVSAQNFEAKEGSTAVLTVSSLGGDVNDIEPFLASLEGSGLSYLDTYEADGIIVNYYESSDYFLEVITTPVDQPDSGGYAGTTRFKLTSKAGLQ